MPDRIKGMMDLDEALRALGAFGGGAAGLAVLWSQVRKRIARDSADADEARSESNWIKRREVEFADREATNKLLLKAVQECNELIAALRMREAVYLERDRIRNQYVRRIEARLKRFDSDAVDWMNTDNSPLGPPEID